MEAKLIVVGGKATKATVPLKKLPTVIGRSPEADLTVGHATISRRHAELFETAGTLMIRDLGSLNGTMVDGQRIKEAPLLPGAKFTIGPLTFQVHYERKGEQGKLPPAVLAEETVDADATREPPTEFPDFEPVDEEPAKKKASTAPNVAKDKKVADDKNATKDNVAKHKDAKDKDRDTGEKKPQHSTSDPFEDLLNELT
jgi:hypothetical protein